MKTEYQNSLTAPQQLVDIVLTRKVGEFTVAKDQYVRKMNEAGPTEVPSRRAGLRLVFFGSVDNFPQTRQVPSWNGRY